MTSQDDYNEAVTVLSKVFNTAYNINRELKFEVFIHKMDGIQEDQKIDLHRDILYRATEELKENGIGNLHLRFVDRGGCVCVFFVLHHNVFVS